jgi:hypothetical protein
VTDMICCPLESGDGESAQCHSTSTVKAAKDHRCCECRETITKGTKHEVVKGMWDHSWSTYRTCLSCVEIRNHFACNGWIYGQVWSDIEENMFPDMKAGGPCMEGLSPEAKGRLFELRLKWLEDSQ